MARRNRRPVPWAFVSKRTVKRKAKTRRSKANHGQKPNQGR
jgi:hypothetical protein